MELTKAFHALETPVSGQSAGHSFMVKSIAGFEPLRLGKDQKGCPALLIPTPEDPNQRWSAPIVLEHLVVQYNASCRVSRFGGGIEEGSFTIIRCISSDTVMHAYFLTIISSIIRLLGPVPSHVDISSVVSRTIELFRALDMAPRKSIQGLWSELFLMALATDPCDLVRAWHVLPEDRFDFSARDQRIEVKSTGTGIRRHHFRLEQLLPPEGTRLLLASMFVHRSAAGTSVLDLAQEVRVKVSGETTLLLHIDQVLTLALGSTLQDGLDQRFDRELAIDSIAFFEPSAIPQLNRDIPAGVSDVHFQADLTGIPMASLDKYHELGGLFKALSSK